MIHYVKNDVISYDTLSNFMVYFVVLRSVVSCEVLLHHPIQHNSIFECTETFRVDVQFYTG